MTLTLTPFKRQRRIHPIMHRLNIGKGLVIKEPVSALSHFAGAIGALAALASLFLLPMEKMSALHFASFIVYTVSMFAVFMASAIYHGLPTTMAGQRLLNKLDHSMIYIFIAGSYLPVFLIGTDPAVGTPLVILVMLIALAGVLFEFFGSTKNRKWGALAYVGMGWLGAFGLQSLIERLPGEGVWLIAIGGVFYTIGALFYAFKGPNPYPRVFGFHEIFHFFVLGGGACHFWAIWFIIRPMTMGNLL